MKMSFEVLIQPAGMTRLVKGQMPYPWDFALKNEEHGGLDQPNSLLIGSCEITLPPLETCQTLALQDLQNTLKHIRAENEEREKVILDAIQNLLALPAPEVL